MSNYDSFKSMLCYVHEELCIKTLLSHKLYTEFYKLPYLGSKEEKIKPFLITIYAYTENLINVTNLIKNKKKDILRTINKSMKIFFKNEKKKYINDILYESPYVHEKLYKSRFKDWKLTDIVVKDKINTSEIESFNLDMFCNLSKWKDEFSI